MAPKGNKNAIHQAAEAAIAFADPVALSLISARAKEMIETEQCSKERSRIWYTRANVISKTRELEHSNKDSVWKWNDPSLSDELVSRREGIFETGWISLGKLQRSWHLTNLANTLDHIGRPIAALDYYSRAMDLYQGRGMVRINRAGAAITLARHLYDPGHAAVLSWYAFHETKLGLKCRISREASQWGRDHLAVLLEHYGKDFFASEPKIAADSREIDSVEAEYRIWCCKHKLFVNPLNDYIVSLAGCRDILSCPSYRDKNNSHPWIFSAFNEIVQQFVTSRSMIWEAMHLDGVQYSDRDVLIYNLNDGVIHSRQVQELKTAFISLWALFDKIACVVRCYWDLSASISDINLRGVWYVNGKYGKGLTENLENKQNWILRGLFWLSKDLSYRPGDRHTEVLEPQIRANSELRVRLEHRFVKVVRDPDLVWDPSNEHLCQTSIDLHDFAYRTIWLARLVREAIIYLSLAIHREDQQRMANDSAIARPILLSAKCEDMKAGQKIDIG